VVLAARELVVTAVVVTPVALKVMLAKVELVDTWTS
jgi:hypothetical protein